MKKYVSMYRRFDILILMLSLLAGCTLIEKNDDGGGGIAPPTPVYPQPYAQPSVSPDGRKLLFVRNKVTRITKSGFFSIDPDSSGIWLADADGINMELLLKGQNFGSPGFSPDMEWILFEAGGQIYKAPFVADSIDADSIIQLTKQGRNFFPDWSPDGQQIVYSNTIGDTVGVWISPADGSSNRTYFTFGAEPDWLSNGEKILYGNRGLWVESVDHSQKRQIFTETERAIRGISGSIDEQRITFGSEGRIFSIDINGSNLKQLTNEGGEPNWTPDGKIVFVRFDPRVFNRDNGTVWIMDADGSNKKQLTRNYGLILEQ